MFAVKAELVCRLVLPGERTWPWEEGILHTWIGGLVVPPLGWGWTGNFKIARDGGAAHDASVTMCPF